MAEFAAHGIGNTVVHTLHSFARHGVGVEGGAEIAQDDALLDVLHEQTALPRAEWVGRRCEMVLAVLRKLCMSDGGVDALHDDALGHLALRCGCSKGSRSAAAFAQPAAGTAAVARRRGAR